MLRFSIRDLLALTTLADLMIGAWRYVKLNEDVISRREGPGKVAGAGQQFGLERIGRSEL